MSTKSPNMSSGSISSTTGTLKDRAIGPLSHTHRSMADVPERARMDLCLHTFICWLTSHTLFNVTILIVIFLSSVTIAMETTSLQNTIPSFFIAIDSVLLVIFLVEFVLKLYAEPFGYWKNRYNLFDFLMLLIAAVQSLLSTIRVGRRSIFLLKVVRVLRAVRILRYVSFVRGLQVLVTALLATFLNAMIPLLFFLFLIMFIFAVMGYYWFGFDHNGDQENWGSFGKAMLSLFTFVTADGWTEIQSRLTARGYVGSEFFTVIFILIGHFLFTNLFIGVIILNIHRATRSFDAAQKAKKDEFIKKKKTAVIQKQHRDVLRVLERQIADNFKNFHEMTEEFQKTLRHDDFVYSTDLCTSKMWIDTFIATLTHLENSKYRVQQQHLELAQNLSDIRELQLTENTEEEQQS